MFCAPDGGCKIVAIRDELIGLVEHKALDFLTTTNIERIKTRSLKRIKQSMSNSKELALKLSEAIACGDFRLFFWCRDQLSRVSLDDVKRVLKTYIIESNRTSGIFRPDKAPTRAHIEAPKDLQTIIDGVVEDPGLSPGEAFLATTQNIEGLIKRVDISNQRIVATLEKKTRGQMVRAQARFRFANERAFKEFHKEFWMVPSMLWRGTTQFDYQGLRDKTDALMSTVDIDGHAGLLLASIKSERAYIGEAVGLLSQMLSDSTFLPREFDIVRQREIDNYEETKSDPQRLGLHELERLKSPWPRDHILYVQTYDEIIEEIKALSIDRIKAGYQKLFSANNMNVALVGDVQGDEILRDLEKLFPIKPDAPSCERVHRPFISNIVEDVKLDTKDKEMAIIAYGVNFPMRDHKDYPTLKLANYLFGENMNSRLMTRIREKEGISYGAGSWLEISRHEEHASLNLYAMASPAVVSRARRAIEEEWHRFLEDGVLEEELALAKESIWLGFMNNLGSDGFLAGALIHDLESKRDFYFRERNLFDDTRSYRC